MTSPWSGPGTTPPCWPSSWGDRKLANLEKLREQARALDRLAPGNLSGFITQLTELVEHPPKEALASTTTEGDVVQDHDNPPRQGA